MNQLNAKLSELYRELPSSKGAFQRKYRQHILNLINQIKHEQTLRRKGLRTQGIWIKSLNNNHYENQSQSPIKFYSQGMGTTSSHSNHIPKPILHHHLLAEVVYRIRLLPNLQIQITHETKKNH